MLAFLLVLSLFWQSAAVAGVYALTEIEDSGHVVMHWQDSEHHHHDDGALHADDSSSTGHHMHADSASNAMGLLTAGWNSLLMLRSGGPAVLVEPPFPSTFPQGLLRPPRTHA